MSKDELTPEERAYQERLVYGSALTSPSREAVLHRLSVQLELKPLTVVHCMDGRELSVIHGYDEVKAIMGNASGPDDVVEMIMLLGVKTARVAVERGVVYGWDEIPA